MQLDRTRCKTAPGASGRPALPGISALLFVLAAWVADLPSALAAGSGSVILTVEGRVEVAVRGANEWTPGRTNLVLEVGDRLRTGFKSRATLRLSDNSILRVKELTTLQIQPIESEGSFLLDLKSGAGYLYNREAPSRMRFRTPQASGAVRGTEFNLAVSEAGETTVTLIDGEVALRNAAGELILRSGEEGSAREGQAPRKTAVLNALNIIQWALYYPAIVDIQDAGLTAEENNALSASVDAYREGDLLGALESYPADREPASDAEKGFRAALLLAVGSVAEAESLLDSMSAPSSVAVALRELIGAVKNQPVIGDLAPSTASEWLARSYSLQARSDLSAALRAARGATETSPRFGAAWIRTAELEFGFGRVDAALKALDTGLELSPKNAQGMALRGFLLSARGDMAGARAWFERAIAADGALGNAWLGRGLVRIRQGEGEAGRMDLMAAAALEPQRALLRSYVGKAFSHTGRPDLADKEFRLAQTLDPNDPTPWLYAALLDQERNEINRAIAGLQTSQELNDNRSLFRSRLLLDQDRAVRSANLAAIYRDAGMTDVSFREAAQSVNHDYANYSAHLFLANSYDALRDPKLINLRYETPWLSELLVAQLLAPVGAGSLSQNISAQEYSRFFEGNRLGVYSGTEYLSSGDWIQRGSQYGVVGQSSYAVDAFYRTENGYRFNNDLEQLSLSARFKQQLTPDDSVFVQASYFDMESGDVAQYYDQDDASRTQRVEERQEPNLYAGYHRQWKPGVHTLILGARLDDSFGMVRNAPIPNLVRGPGGAIIGGFINNSAIELESEFEAYSAELQQIWQHRDLTLVGGARYQTGESVSRSSVGVVAPIVSPSIETDLERISAYAYAYWQVIDPVQLIAGVSYDSLDYPENIDLAPISGGQQSREQVSPKAGFYLTPLKTTTVRGIYSQSLGGLFYDTSVRLEPTQLAGFNQAFRSIIPESVAGLVPGSRFETFGLALDQRFGYSTYISVAGEILYSDADRTMGVLNLGIPTVPSGSPEELEFRERSLSVYLNRLLGPQWAVGAGYRLVDADFDDRFDELPAALAPPDSDVSSTLHQVTLQATWNLPRGFFAQGRSTWSRQSNHGYDSARPGEEFWQHDLMLGYRFLRRRAEARFGLLNITDRDYRLNPVTLYNELPRERTFALSLRLFF